MTITVSDITRRTKYTLNDIGSIRWIGSENIDAINDALDAILIAKPDLFEEQGVITLVTGNLQSIPSDGYMLFDALWNIDADDTQGRRITRVKRSVLDRHRSSWTEAGSDNTVRHWAQDKGERVNFYVAPYHPASETRKVRIRYAKRPAEITSETDTIDGIDEMGNAIYYFAVARLLEKDEKFAGSPQATSYMTKFAQAVGVRVMGEESADAQTKENEG